MFKDYEGVGHGAFVELEAFGDAFGIPTGAELSGHLLYDSEDGGFFSNMLSGFSSGLQNVGSMILGQDGLLGKLVTSEDSLLSNVLGTGTSLVGNILGGLTGGLTGGKSSSNASGAEVQQLKANLAKTNNVLKEQNKVLTMLQAELS